MKILVLSLLMATGMLANLGQSSGEHEIIVYVADAFQVDEGDVSLSSPNLVTVDLQSGPIQGTASFTNCGTECTEVEIVFPGRTLEFIVENEIEGL